MKNLQGQLEALKANIYFEYGRFKKTKFPINFAQKKVDNWENTYKKELQALLDNGDYIGMFDYDFFEFLPTIFFLNRNGEENHAFVLEVNNRGIKIFCNETDKVLNIYLHNLTTLDNQIELLEEIENF